MKKIIAFFALFLTATTLLACFNSNPGKLLGNTSQTMVSENGGQVTVTSQPWGSSGTEWEWLDSQKGLEIEPTAVIDTSLPLTINLEFSGFVNDDGSADTDIVQLAIYYFDKTAGWTALKVINNPSYPVITDTPKALFGRHTVTGPLGYNKDEYIPVVFYFKSRSGKESFPLVAFLELRHYRAAAPFLGISVLALRIRDNHIAY